LRHCSPRRKDAGSNPDGVLGFFIDLNLPAALWPLGPLSLLGGRDGWCIGLTILPPSFAELLKIWGASASWSLKGLSRPVMA